MNQLKHHLLATILVTTSFLFAKEMFIVAPYYGNIYNAYIKNGVNLQDTQMMNGLHLQYVDPANSQINAFLFQAPNVNYSQVSGIHANADWYFGEGDKWVYGCGYDNILINMNAGNNIAGLTLFKLQNDVKEVYVRFGKYISAGEWLPGLKTRFLPYIGYGTESVGGSTTVDPAGPPPQTVTPISTVHNYPLAGLNSHFNFNHFIEVDAKYRVMYMPAKPLISVTLQSNFYFTRSLGLSYQYKYMELSSGGDIYNILGVMLVL